MHAWAAAHPLVLGAASGAASLVQSPWAALPSGHVAFALVAGGDRRPAGPAGVGPGSPSRTSWS